MPSAQRFPIAGVRNVDLQVPDLGRARDFYTEIWGLHLCGDHDGVLYLRGTGSDAYILALRQGKNAGIDCITFRLAPATDTEQMQKRVIAAGAHDVRPVTQDGPGGGSGISFRDPRGRRIVLVRNDTPVAPLAGGTGTLTRLAHVNINCAAIEADIAFYRDALGFELTDRTQKMGFLRTNSDHHVLVLAEDNVNTLNHVAFLHEDWESVMKAGGKLCDAGYHIGWGPGRHGPGDNVFLYFVDPFGIVIEHTAEVLEIDETYRVGTPQDWIWPPGRTDQWGIAPPKTEECKAAQRLIPFLD
jgi:catechol 2,3-dioxygenase-like lactoylglutathione lyase family enzyme